MNNNLSTILIKDLINNDSNEFMIEGQVALIWPENIIDYVKVFCSVCNNRYLVIVN